MKIEQARFNIGIIDYVDDWDMVKYSKWIMRKYHYQDHIENGGYFDDHIEFPEHMRRAPDSEWQDIGR